MMQTVVLIGREALRHRLDTLAIATPDQARNIHRTHLSPLLVVKLYPSFLLAQNL